MLLKGEDLAGKTHCHDVLVLENVIAGQFYMLNILHLFIHQTAVFGRQQCHAGTNTCGVSHRNNSFCEVNLKL